MTETAVRERLLIAAGNVGQPREINVFTHPDASCPCVTNHVPSVITLNKHHVWPLGMGGPDTPDNLVVVCPTVHYSIHHLLREWVKLDGEPPWELRRRFGPYPRSIAERGYALWVEAGRP